MFGLGLRVCLYYARGSRARTHVRVSERVSVQCTRVERAHILNGLARYCTGCRFNPRARPVGHKLPPERMCPVRTWTVDRTTHLTSQYQYEKLRYRSGE